MSKMNIRGSEYPLKRIFSADFVFTIPPYQRAYAWTTEESEELLQDLLRAMHGEEESIDELPPYFLGSIVLIKDDEPDAQVVDGQQRLATLTMLLSALRSLVKPEYIDGLTSFLCEKGNIITGTPKRYRLRLRERDAQFFQKYIQDEDGIEELKNLSASSLPESQRNIRDNTLGFIRELQKLSEKHLMALTQFIMNRCFLIVVSVSSPNLDSVYRIFSVLNSRGLTDLERLAVSFMLRRVPPYQRFDRYYDLLRAIHEGIDLYAPNSPLQLTSRECQEVLRMLNGDMYHMHYVCRYILLRLDGKLSEWVASYDYKTISIEHVLPQRPSPESKWVKTFPSKEMREKYVHRLGNLVLLSQGRNMKAENFDFDEKKRKYFMTNGGISPFVLTTQVLQHREWTPAIIEKRQNELIGTLKQLWRL